MRYLVILLLLLLSCSNKSVSDNWGGTGTGVGNGIVVTGVVVADNSEPLSNATLEIVSKDHLENSSNSLADTVQTDSVGKFTWETDSSGSFRMWIIEESGVGAIRDITIDSTKDRVELDTIKTAPLRNYWLSFAGASPLEQLEVELYGSRLVYSATVEALIHFQIPEGDHFAKISFSSDKYSTIDSVKLVVNDTVPVAALPDDMIATNFYEDSLILNAMIRMNFPTLSPGQIWVVYDTATLDDGEGLRMTKLTILGCDTLPPFVGGLTAVESLTVREGTFKTIPKEIGQMHEKLKKLDLSYNFIETIPDELCSLENIVTLNMTGNPRFDPYAQSPSVQEWLRGFWGWMQE